MSDTQTPGAQPSDMLQERIESLISLHTYYKQRRAQVFNELQAIDGSLLKLEGAIESLADFKSSAYSTQPETLSEGDETSEEVVDAEYQTESVN